MQAIVQETNQQYVMDSIEKAINLVQINSKNGHGAHATFEDASKLTGTAVPVCDLWNDGRQTPSRDIHFAFKQQRKPKIPEGPQAHFRGYHHPVNHAFSKDRKASAQNACFSCYESTTLTGNREFNGKIKVAMAAAKGNKAMGKSQGCNSGSV